MDISDSHARLHVEYLPIADLKVSPNNPRQHSRQQIQLLSRAIKELGFNNPILIDRDNIVVAGHGRLEAAGLQALERVPTIRLEHLTPAQVKAYRIADNRIAELSEWDMPALRLELQSLSDLDLSFDLTLTGFELPKLDMMLNPIVEESVMEDISAVMPCSESVTQVGDVWALGHHRIVCGDALNPETYQRLLQGEVADLVFTDPPYNVPVKGHILTDNKHGHNEFRMAAGEMSDLEFEEFLRKVISQLQQHSTQRSIHYICMDWRHIRHLLSAGYNYSDLKNICIWNKNNGGMGSLYRSKHEMVAVFKNGKEPHVNNIELGKHGRYRTNVWDYAGQTSIGERQGKELEMHPTPKPVEMIADAILDCSNRGQLILDPFGGSGSTLLAAEKTNRSARLIEIEPCYVDVSIRRWQKLTQQKAVLSSTGQSFDDIGQDSLGAVI